MTKHLRSVLKPLITVIAIFLAGYQIYTTAGIAIVDGTLQKVTHLSLVLSLVFLWVPYKKFPKEEMEPWLFVIVDIALSLLSLGVAAFYYLYADIIFDRIRYVDPVTSIEMFFGVSTVLLTLEATRRTAGWPLVIVSISFIIYALFGADIPGPFQHAGVSPSELIEQLFLLTDGIYGLPIAAAATMIYAFVIFGAFLERSGMSTLFIDLACLVTRNAKGGPAKVSIFASALFGTISGSAPANVYGTGIFTIPLMKRVGYSPSFAGAVESAASTGGQLMPPIMGAAAFIMADITGVGYLNVIKAALLPSIMFYLSLWLMIHFEAVKKNLGSIPPEDVPSVKHVLSRLYYMIPLAFLIGVLVMGRSVTSAAYVGCLVVIAVALFRQETRIKIPALRDIAVLAAKNTLMVTACCACAGIIVGVMGMTGGGFKFINLIVSFVDGNLFMLLVLLVLTCFIVGMGVPTAPAYIIVSVLAAPAMIELGVSQIAAHMFVLYYAVLSAITPPVCLAAFAGAAIAEADAMKTGFDAVKLSLIAFIVPFFFAYEPALMLIGSFNEVSIAVITSIIGIICLAGGVQGWFIIRCAPWQSFLLITGGLCMIFPGIRSDLLGFGLAGAVFLLQMISRKRKDISVQ